MVMILKDVGVNLEQEIDAASFLSICMECDSITRELEMNQEGLILCIVEAMGLDVGIIIPKWTPANAAPLVKDYLKLQLMVLSATVVLLECYSIFLVILVLILLMQSIVRHVMFCPKKSHEKHLK